MSFSCGFSAPRSTSTVSPGAVAAKTTTVPAGRAASTAWAKAVRPTAASRTTSAPRPSVSPRTSPTTSPAGVEGRHRAQPPAHLPGGRPWCRSR